jgi:hypothetical protein
MIVKKGEKVHVIMRRFFDEAVRRHFVGEIIAAEGAVVRLEGYVFIHDPTTIQYVRKPEKRTTVIDLAESGYIVNFILSHVDVAKLSYKYIDRKLDRKKILVVTDGDSFSLDINEFGMSR